MEYKLIAFYAPKKLEVNAFDKSFDFKSIENKAGVVLIDEVPYKAANCCRFDILTIQRLLKGEKNVRRKGRIVSKEGFVPNKIVEFANHYSFSNDNCEYDAVKENKLPHGGQTGNFKAELDDVNFFIVKQKLLTNN